MKAVITGSTKGIGRAIAELLADKGYDLALCARSEEDLAAFKLQLEKAHTRINVLAVSADVSRREDLAHFAERILSKWSSVDLLVNNAGVFFPGKLLEEKEDMLPKLIETNVYSAYYLCRALIPGMIEHGAGHVVNICSVASLKAYPSGGSYSISKFALYGLTKALREELKEDGIRVTAVLPGATWSNSWAGTDLPEDRMMKTSDIAHLVWAAHGLSNRSVVEDIVVRPQLGDL